MAINSLQEYEKVVNVSWFSQEKLAEELTYVALECQAQYVLTTKVSVCPPILPDVSALLHRYSKLSQPILLLLRRPFPAPERYRRHSEESEQSLSIPDTGQIITNSASSP